MRESIKLQIEKCAYAKPDSYDEPTRTWHFPKYSKPRFDPCKCYLVKVAKHIVKNPSSTTAVNWNNGAAPQFDHLKVYVSKALGKMIYVESIGFDPESCADLNYLWSGWLNVDEITLIKKI